MFTVSDDHQDEQGPFQTLEEAIAEVQRLAAIPWDQEPNRAPCTEWRTCGRNWEIVSIDDDSPLWPRGSSIPAVAISAEGVRWAEGFPPT